MLIKDFKLILSEKRFYVFIGIVLIITFAAVLFGKANYTTPKVSIGVSDLDKSQYSVLLIDYFRQNEVFSSYIDVVELDEDELKEEFFNGAIDMYLVIPENFASNLIQISNIPIRAVINSSEPTKAVVYKTLLESYGRYITSVEVNCQSLYEIMINEGYSRDEVNSENVAVSYDLLFTALGKDAFFEIRDTGRITGISLVNYYIYSAIMLFILYLGAFAGLELLKENLSKVTLRLESIGIKKGKMTISKTVSYTLVFGSLILLCCIIVNNLSEFSFAVNSIFGMLLATFISCLVFSIISNCFKTQSSYIVFSNMMILLLTIVGGGIIPVMYLPETLSKVAQFTPNYWFIKMLL